MNAQGQQKHIENLVISCKARVLYLPNESSFCWYNSNLKIPHHSLAHPQLTNATANPQFSLETKNTLEANAEMALARLAIPFLPWYNLMQRPTTCDLMLFHFICFQLYQELV